MPALQRGLLACALLLALAGCGGQAAEADRPQVRIAARASATPVAASPTATARPTATPSPTPIPSPTPTPGLDATVDLGYIPILMYHYIRTVDPDVDPLGFRLSVTPERFAEQIAWLAASDFTPMRMRDIAECLRGLRTCPPNPVALTFDDGYEDNALNALPVLKRHNVTATFYIVSGSVGAPGYMSWEQLAELRDSGMEIGAHTVSHADLTALSPEQALAEVVQSREVLERQLGVPVLSFSYPAGAHSDELAELVRQSGYTSAVTTRQTSDLSQLYQLARRRVLGGESIAGYPWYFQSPE